MNLSATGTHLSRDVRELTRTTGVNRFSNQLRDITMSLERATLAIAGIMVLLSVALTTTVHANFVWLTVFVGANMLQSVFTGFCPAAMLLQRLGVQSERDKALAGLTSR
jgi:hypothetical protein